MTLRQPLETFMSHHTCRYSHADVCLGVLRGALAIPVCVWEKPFVRALAPKSSGPAALNCSPTTAPKASLSSHASSSLEEFFADTGISSLAFEKGISQRRSHHEINPKSPLGHLQDLQVTFRWLTSNLLCIPLFAVPLFWASDQHWLRGGLTDVAFTRRGNKHARDVSQRIPFQIVPLFLCHVYKYNVGCLNLT